ncbi:hypothetical protein B0J12DRAFT_358871 [Macrophomina phaseolina]|uniref:Uncharacterized protein n=1 Tax=Macrophomina phaseolina TaxID=35725 RepID=A0ABQ8FUF3_9PEZI|nr:hypothetical protein B0J12DRAFT_358871 [Macrophomina phaseolina]
MPRRLPWLNTAPAKPHRQAAAHAAKKQRLHSPGPLDDLDSPHRASPARKGKARTTRTPSSSPPPQPPRQECMREGYAADDIWMMVEDEFIDTARLFTQHLHHAEYHRLERVAREKNATALQNISRPVVARGKMSTESQRKYEAQTRAERRAGVLRDIERAGKDLEESEDDAPWARDPYLGGLMSGSQDSTIPLSTIAGIKSKTRAAAGYVGAPLKPPPRNIGTLKPSTVQASKSSVAGLAKEIRRAAASSDEEDLDRYSSSRKPTTTVSVRRSSASSTDLADAREASMPPPKPAKHSAPSQTPLTQCSSFNSRTEPRSNTFQASSTSARAQPSVSTASTSSATGVTKSTKRKVLTSRFASFSAFSELDEVLQPKTDEGAKKSPGKPPEKPSNPSMTKDRDHKEKKSISADEIPTFLF